MVQNKNPSIFSLIRSKSQPVNDQLKDKKIKDEKLNIALSALMSKYMKIDNRTKYEFPKFQDSLVNLIAEKEKQNTLIMALFPLARDGIERKCKLLERRIYLKATLRGGLSKENKIYFDFILKN